MSEDKSPQGCVYIYIPDDDIHLFDITEASREAADATMISLRAFLAYLRESEVKPDDTALLLIDNRGTSTTGIPISYVFNEARKIVRHELVNCHYRMAIVLAMKSPVISMLQPLINGMRIPRLQFAFFKPDEYDKAYAWLLQKN